MGLITRRQLIGAAAGLSLVGPGLALPASGISIKPRSSWGSDHPPKGPLESEDVKFLIVHHSASRNGHTTAEVPGILRSWYNFHTGPEKGWNDVAYNFCIDSEGVIWEARKGSIDGPVAGDATGGNQGFTQLVCIIGDYNTAQPTQASLDSLVQLLAWLAERYGISTSPGSEVTFTSRGSNKWPEGAQVTTPTITGHRTMSKTTCPGDNLNAYVVGSLMADVQAVREGGSPTPSSSTTAAPTSTVAPSTTSAPSTTTTTRPSTTIASTSTSAPSTSVPQSTTAPSTAPPTTPASPSTTLPVAAEPTTGQGTNPLLVGAGALVALGSGVLIWRYNRLNS